MSSLDRYTDEEIEAVIEHFFPVEHYPREELSLTVPDIAALMDTFGGATTVLRVRASKLGLTLGETLHLPELRSRIKAWWEQR